MVPGDVPAASPSAADFFGAQDPTLGRCFAWMRVDCPTDFRLTVPEMYVFGHRLAILRRRDTVALPGAAT